jgi:zinc D-Ala-D-Ala dipeptidase
LKAFNFIAFCLLLCYACKEKPTNPQPEFGDGDTLTTEEKIAKPSEQLPISKDTIATKEEAIPSKVEEVLVKKETTTNAVATKVDFKELTKSQGITVDIKYATKDNFTKKQIYPCGKCYLRPEAALAIEKANKILQSKHNYSLKMFDCYRPRPAQQRLWDVVPNADYVTPPAKGSMHNRGLAVDLTIVDANGKDLDMGTPYDFFGKEAHTDNLSLPADVLNNRKLLTSVMKEVGFSGIRTEWWHFSYDAKAELSDWEWPCK